MLITPATDWRSIVPAYVCLSLCLDTVIVEVYVSIGYGPDSTKFMTKLSK